MKPSEELSALVETIKYNCDVADADGSAIFSICGMALRLRDLNKWEMGLPPWKENDSNPFDTQTINRILAPSGSVLRCRVCPFPQAHVLSGPHPGCIYPGPDTGKDSGRGTGQGGGGFCPSLTVLYQPLSRSG